MDWKSSGGLYTTFLAQTAIYQEAFEEETGEKIEQRFIIRLGKDDGEFETWHTETDEDFQQDLSFFLNALALYRSMRTVESRVDAVKNARKQRRKESLAVKRAVKCPDADRYKGVRQKKGCNGTDMMCGTCKDKYREHNSEIVVQ